MDILLENVYKAYGERQVLAGFTARFPAGSRTALMGPSGVGKTTLARLLMGLEKPDAGRVRVSSAPRFGCVFQEDRLCEGFSAGDNVALALPRARWGGIDAALLELGLWGDDLQKPVSALSGGQKRRVALARAVEAESSALVLDEAFKGLDEENKQRAYAYIRSRLGARTLLLITHDEGEAAALGAAPLLLGEKQA